MLLTEKEAKEKDCYQWINEDGEVSKPYCQGSGCMAWRWDEKSKQKYVSVKCSEEYPDGLKRVLFPTAEWKGYCGLAGEVK